MVTAIRTTYYQVNFFRGVKKPKATKKKKKETLFYGRTDPPSRVGQLGLFKNILFLSGGKNDSV